MYAVVIGNHGNAVSPLASLPASLLPLFPPVVASFPQARLLPPDSLRPPRASHPPATFKYSGSWKGLHIFTEHISRSLCRTRDMRSIQQVASNASMPTKSYGGHRQKPIQSGLTVLPHQHPLAPGQEHFVCTRIIEKIRSIEKPCFAIAVYSTHVLDGNMLWDSVLQSTGSQADAGKTQPVSANTEHILA